MPGAKVKFPASVSVSRSFHTLKHVGCFYITYWLVEINHSHCYLHYILLLLTSTAEKLLCFSFDLGSYFYRKIELRFSPNYRGQRCTNDGFPAKGLQKHIDA